MAEAKHTPGSIPSPHRVTLRDLARELGVSDRAVSQALNPRDSNVKLNPATVERIQKLATQLNYRPDSRARSMRYGRFYNIGYFEAKKSAVAWPLLGAESGIYDAASENRYNVTLIRLPSDLTENQTLLPNVFREAHLDALILSHTGNLTKEFEKAIDASGFPVIYLNEKRESNAVYVDDVRGAETITQHLIESSHRHIAFLNIGPQWAHYSVPDRVLGYQQAMDRAGLPTTILDFPDPNFPADAPLLEKLRAMPELDAIVTYSDFTALILFRALYQLSRKVPETLSVTGFGDDFGRECSPVLLTTMNVPFYQMGRAAIEMAMELINSGATSIPSRIFEAELVIRDSTTRRKPVTTS